MGTPTQFSVLLLDKMVTIPSFLGGSWIGMEDADNAANDDDPSAGRAYCRITRRGNGNDGQGGQVGGQGSEVNDGVDGVPDFSTIIAQQLQIIPIIVAE
ncbi:hypothetical protein Tco_0613816 [Tanacetum coccineum]